jgi:S1-C subfamily serine protease
LLRQPGGGPQHIVRAAVVIERIQNLFSSPPLPEDRPILDQIQSWSSLTNGNVSLLVADVARSEELPPFLVGTHRSGVSLINVGLPDEEEINQLFISAETGSMAGEFGERTARQNVFSVRINESQRGDLINRLQSCDAVTIRSYFKTCEQRQIDELTMRTLRTVVTRASDAWPELLEESNLQQVEEKLRSKVRGQEYALNRIMGTLRVIRENLHYQTRTGQTEEKVLAYFFFAGPTGVGKTETYRVLDEAFSQIRTLKFNMPEYKEEHSAARFFGAPPGYVGHGRGELGEFLLENPAAIVLFDEFEKAHPNIWKNFLTMLEGSMTTGDGIRVDLSQAIFIFTSNAGASDLQPIHPSMSDGQQENIRNQNSTIVQGALRQAGAPPELIGRLLEAIIPFNHMTEDMIGDIIRINLEQLAEQTEARFHASIEAFLFDLFAQQGQFGARMICQHIHNRLKADVISVRPPRGTIYKDADGLTRHEPDASTISRSYERKEGEQQQPTRQQVQVNTTSDQAFRDTVVPAIAALLSFDTGGTCHGSGTGFFITSTGYLLTNRHVIAGSTQIQAIHQAGQMRTDMVIVGVSDYFDLAVLRPVQAINGGVDYLAMANSGSVEVDTEVLTFGYPYLEYDPATQQINFTQPERSERGHIGVRLEEERLFRLSGVGLNPGNSGGPLFRCETGDVIGVVITAKRSASEGMSFAIMSSVAQAFLREMGVVQTFTRLG